MTWDSVFRFRFSEKNMGLTLILMLQLVFVVYFRHDRFGAESSDSALNISTGKLDTSSGPSHFMFQPFGAFESRIKSTD